MGAPGAARRRLAHDGHHVVLSTGTASGKSLGYLMPALTAITTTPRPTTCGARPCSTSRPPRRWPRTSSAALRALGVPGLAATTHDGDSPREQRDWARDHAEYLLTNPDMLHRSLLPGHARWSTFLSLLQFVVIDECHHYRGRVRRARRAGAAPAAAGLRAVRRRRRRSCSPRRRSPSPPSRRRG